jgi:hypothetical protein
LVGLLFAFAVTGFRSSRRFPAVRRFGSLLRLVTSSHTVVLVGFGSSLRLDASAGRFGWSLLVGFGSSLRLDASAGRFGWSLLRLVASSWLWLAGWCAAWVRPELVCRCDESGEGLLLSLFAVAAVAR